MPSKFTGTSSYLTYLIQRTDGAHSITIIIVVIMEKYHDRDKLSYIFCYLCGKEIEVVQCQI